MARSNPRPREGGRTIAKEMGRIGRAQAIAWLMGRQLGGAEPELQRTPGGARLVQNGSVLSVVLSQPGPTDSVFDVLAAAMNLSTEIAQVSLALPEAE